jgi:radical SAM superfamily enzyme
MLYYKFSEYLNNRYGVKVYKIPVNIPVTCPNRDGRISVNGCIFCGDEGAGLSVFPII